MTQACRVCDPPENCIHNLPPPALRAELVCTCSIVGEYDSLCPRHGQHYTTEQRAALQEAAVAMQNTEMRESVRAVIETAMGINVETFKGVCQTCGKRGIWRVGTEAPLTCGPCAAEEKEDV